jgi:hypothetical protein
MRMCGCGCGGKFYLHLGAAVFKPAHAWKKMHGTRDVVFASPLSLSWHLWTTSSLEIPTGSHSMD